jgi:hypothetical protein
MAIRNVLVAVDGSASSPRASAPCTNAISGKAILPRSSQALPARARCSQIHLFHAYTCPYEGKLRQANLSEESVEQLRTQYVSRAKCDVAVVPDFKRL